MPRHTQPSPVQSVNPLEVLSVFQSLLSRAALQSLLLEAQVRLYWRTLTPLVVLWGMIYQCLSADPSCDSVVSYLHSGAADHLDPADPHAQPLSQRLRSESTSGYVQARQRLPETVVRQVLQRSYLALQQRWQAAAQEADWHGHAVRYLDGTTIRVRPEGDLAEVYTAARNQYGAGYWVVARVVAAFCLATEAVVGVAEGDWSQSETALARQVLADDPLRDSIYIGDQGFGVYRLVQSAVHYGQHVLLRLEARSARRLWRAHYAPPLTSGQQGSVMWAPGRQTVTDPTLPAPALAGRLLYQRLERAGFRPVDLYLFTTLVDPQRYALAELVALYGQRQQVETNLRHLKQTLGLAQLAVKSADLLRKELLVGLLTYNLVRGLMGQAAHKVQLSVRQLSFSRCWRRLRELVHQGVPAWVLAQDCLLPYILERLARCRLPHQPTKVRHEPRRVRHTPKVFPALLGSRHEARQALLDQATPSLCIS
jgi:hypothetical protein